MSNPPGKPDTALPNVPPRPKSAVSTGVGMAGLVGMFSWVAIARYYGMDGPWSALMNVAWCGIPMVLWSLFVDKVHRNPSTGIDWDSPAKRPTETRDLSMTKLAGLWATWCGIAAVYGLCRWYWKGNYLFSMEIFAFCAIPLFFLSIPYVMWLDTRLKEPRDGAWHFGRWLMGRKDFDAEAIRNHWRSWTVKGFFIAFMFSIVPGGFSEFIRMPIADVIANPVRLGLWLIGLMFVIDVAFATVGYLLTMKPLDAHIRTANPFLGGWLAALMCYPPFALMYGGGPLDYRPGTESWTYWFEGHPWILGVWAAALVALTAIYAWATIAFGLRFSNLTNRGVLTHGPYAWTKHPAYLAKNTFWWLETLPFLVTTNSVADAVRNTVILGLVSAVYFWRAKTEEAHLTRDDPVYAEYAAWMDKYGLITSRIRRLTKRGLQDPVAVPAE